MVLGRCKDLRTSKKNVMRRDKAVLYNWVLSQYWNQIFRRALLVADPAFCVPSVCLVSLLVLYPKKQIAVEAISVAESNE